MTAPLSSARLLLQRAWATLAHARLGVACSLVTATLCGIGSLLVRFAPSFYRRHLGSSWDAPRWHTLWLWGLLIVATVWSVHALLHVMTAIPAVRQRRYRALGLALAQLGLVVAWSSYFWLVLLAPAETIVVTDKAVDVHGETYRVLRVEPGRRDASPPKPTVAWLERRVGDATAQLRIVRGQYFRSAQGTHLLVVMRGTLSADGAILRHGNERVSVSTAKPQSTGRISILLERLLPRKHLKSGRLPHADVKIDGRRTLLPLDPEWAGENAFLGLKETPACVLRVRRDYCTQLFTIAVTLALFGLLFAVARPRVAAAPSESTTK